MEDTYGYTKSLIQERQRLVWQLELQRQEKLLSADDYTSCRKSLSKAIEELEAVLRSMEETHPADNPGG